MANSAVENVDNNNNEEIAGVLLNQLPPQLEQDSFCSLIFPPNEHLYLIDLVSDAPDINLLCVDQFETDAFRKKMMDLFKIRRKMKQKDRAYIKCLC